MKKFSPFFAPMAVLLIIAYNQTFARTDAEKQLAETSREPATSPIALISNSCHQQWQTLNWKIGDRGILAKNNPAFNEGIKKICQARAELFFEGYELSPFIGPDSQNQVYPIVFRSSVKEIKEQIRLHLPKLRLI